MDDFFRRTKPTDPNAIRADSGKEFMQGLLDFYCPLFRELFILVDIDDNLQCSIFEVGNDGSDQPQ